MKSIILLALGCGLWAGCQKANSTSSGNPTTNAAAAGKIVQVATLPSGEQITLTNVDPLQKVQTLPSGKKITITGVGPLHFTDGETALVIGCETDISIDDTVALRKEVDEIWGLFKKDVELANLTNGVIRMVHPEAIGSTKNSKGYGFVFVKRADGLWHCLQDEKK